ncbi:MAG TPA: hypothetical protein PLO57_01650 [Candidatus Cloacimonadota bacterium]|nr:hypothetical protein [Candidatus Cloacimonadota bacterium]
MHRIADGAQSASWCSNGKRSVKSLLTQEQIIPCLGNSCAQDIMFMSGMHPRENLVELGSKELDLHYYKLTPKAASCDTRGKWG